ALCTRTFWPHFFSEDHASPSSLIFARDLPGVTARADRKQNDELALIGCCTRRSEFLGHLSSAILRDPPRRDIYITTDYRSQRLIMLLTMERVTGIGGVFFRAKDPETLSGWYENTFG